MIKLKIILGGRHLKVNHIKHDSGFVFDSFFLEVAGAMVCTVFAIMGYHAQLVLLFVPTGLVALGCYCLIIHALYRAITQYLSHKKAP